MRKSKIRQTKRLRLEHLEKRRMFAADLGYDISQLESRIVGGNQASNADHPWIVSLQIDDGHVCGGSLISPDIVVTAAHCFDQNTADEVTVVGGINTLNQNGAASRIDELIVHPDYEASTMDSDIAILKLVEELDQPTISYARSHLGHLFAPGVDATLAGWGATTFGGMGSTQLLAAEVPIVANAIANQTYGDRVTENMLAAGFADGGVDSCQGDSGGPMTVPDRNGNAMLAGVVSWGSGCAWADNYGVYTKVANFANWIDQYAIPDLKGSFEGTGVKWHDWFSIQGEQPLTGDFNGDGKDDVVTFTRGTTGDAYVALSNGRQFVGTGQKWHDWFSIRDEIPLVGDFNGDGKDDVVTFTRGTTGDAYVALSNGRQFVGTGQKWHDWFSIGDEIPLVGDFNGDGMDDIATFTRGRTGDVYVALSNGHEFIGTGQKWHNWFSVGEEIPLVGDFNGDGMDDIATFTRGVTGDVYVATSNGHGFEGTGERWHDWFSIRDEVPKVGDFNGDGLDDIVTFTRGSHGDAYVAISNGENFAGTGVKWHDWFSVYAEIPDVGDFDGDGKSDVVTFVRGGAGDVYVATAAVPETERLLGDANRDHLVDFADFLIVSRNFGQSATGVTQGDFNNDGKIGFADFLLLSAEYGKRQT